MASVGKCADYKRKLNEMERWMMLIQVSEEFRIKSDTRNVIVERMYMTDPTKSPNWKQLEEKGADPSPRESWREVSYHSTVAKAIVSIGEQKVRDSEATTLKELLDEIRDFNGEIRALLDVESQR